MVAKLSGRFGGAVDAVRRIKQAVEENYSKFTTDPGSYTECCKVDDASWETYAYLNTKVCDYQ